MFIHQFGYADYSLAITLIALLSISTDAESKTPRSTTARHEFVRLKACPATDRHRLPCPGYVIDHTKALACGGADEPANMQWQTAADAKAKDKWERKECGK